MPTSPNPPLPRSAPAGHHDQRGRRYARPGPDLAARRLAHRKDKERAHARISHLITGVKDGPLERVCEKRRT
jgi:hypothetical protein